MIRKVAGFCEHINKLLASINKTNLLTTLSPISFSREILFRGISRKQENAQKLVAYDCTAGTTELDLPFLYVFKIIKHNLNAS
jgi:hypothetical protein